MVRYIDPKDNPDDKNKDDVTQKNIINKAFQQEIKRNQDNLSSKSKDFLSQAFIVQEKNEQIDRLKKEKQSLSDQLNQVASERTFLQKEIASLKVRMQYEHEQTESIPLKERNEQIGSLERQINDLNDQLRKKDDQIAHLNKHGTNPKEKIGVRRLSTIRVIGTAIVLSAMAVIFFNLIPQSFEAEAVLDAPSADEKHITTTISAITRPERLQTIVAKHEPSLNTSSTASDLERLTQSYQKRLHFRIDPQDKRIHIMFSASTPEKAAGIVRDASLLFYQAALIDPQKQTLQKEITRTDTQLKFLEKNIQVHQQEIDQVRLKQTYQEIDPSIYNTLQNRTQGALKSIEEESDKIQQQLKKIAQDTPSLQQSNLFALLTLERLNESPELRNLLDRLQTQEFYCLVYSLPNIGSEALINERARAIADIKRNIVDMVKSYLNVPLSLEMETDLSLYFLNLFLRIKQQAIHQILDEEYITKDEFGQITQNIESDQKQIQQLKKKRREISKQSEKLRIRLEQLDAANSTIKGLTVRTSNQLTFYTRIVLLFCLIGISFGLVGAAIRRNGYSSR